ncbi:uncharacterized protein LOC142335897 isoform X2 [Convolutriloba macropyga]|uniref:uncharacterized protein LOC142335897 isoform X2 n=1 Tax=Convolutriloba macropyga TaxID=536237 RepID=UPI003F522271
MQLYDIILRQLNCINIRFGDIVQFNSRVVTSVTLFYTAPNNGHVCGVEMLGELVGCNNTNSHQYTVGEGYEFAGFITLSSDDDVTADNYLLLPLQFGPPGTWRPEEPETETETESTNETFAYYVNENSDSSKFTFSLSSPATEVTIVAFILDSRNETTGEVDFTEYIHNVTLNETETTFEIDLLKYNGEKLDRPCTMIVGNLTTNAKDSNYTQFTAFTGGYTIDATETFSWPENITEDGSEKVYTTLPRHSVIEGLATGGEVCDLDFIGETYSIGMKDGVMIADDEWLGPDQGESNATEFAEGQFVNGVDVIYNSTTDVIRGIRFRFSNGSETGIGENEDSYNHSTYSFNYTGSGVLSYFKIYMRGSEMVKLEAFWMRPAAPWNIWTQNVKDHSSGFYKGFFSESDDDDADQIEVRFWLPFDSIDDEAVTMSINGTFERGNGVDTDLTLDGSSTSFRRGADYNTRAFYLMAQTSYSFSLSGVATIPELDENLTSLSSEIFHFETPNGARLLCTQDANMTYQIEYESVPEIKVHATSGDEVIFGDVNNSLSVNDFDAHTFCDPHDCFQFPYSVNQFRGYIKRVEIYYLNGTDDYIRGFTVYYKEADGGTVSFELAGDQEIDSNETEFVSRYVDFEDEGTVPAGFDYDTKDSRLARMQFKDINNASIGDCMGPTSTAGNCSTVGSRSSEKSNSASPDYFICGFEIKVSNNQSAEPGVYSITPVYASIDFPTLLRSSRAEGCELTAHLDYFYVRNSAWDFTQIISNDTQCGTQQKVYNLGDTSHTPRADEIDPGFKHSAVYYQVITQESGAESGGLINGSGIRISRSGLWEATAFCYYDAEGRVHSSFGVEQEDSLVLHGTQEFSYKMQIAQSSAFTSFFDPSAATALLNDEVYVKVSFDPEVNHDYTLITTDCWATQTEDYTSNTRYVLSANKCPADDSFERLTGSELDEEFFQFKAFGWYISGSVTLNTVYIHCKVLACPPQDTSACDINCNKRHKRDLATGDSLGITVRTGMVSSSPIVVVRRGISEQTALAGPNSQYSPLAASLASLFILVAFAALLAAIGLFVVKQRKISSGQAYQRLDSNHAD